MVECDAANELVQSSNRLQRSKSHESRIATERRPMWLSDE